MDKQKVPPRPLDTTGVSRRGVPVWGIAIIVGIWIAVSIAFLFYGEWLRELVC